MSDRHVRAEEAAAHDVPGLRLPAIADAEMVELHLTDVTLGGYLFSAPGARRALLIVHGWGEDGATHAPMARFFRAAGFHVLTVSLRGSRGSSGCDDYGLRQPRDVREVLAWLTSRTGAGAVFLYGYSQGGLVTLLTLAGGARVTAAAALNAPTDLRGFARDTAFPFITAYLEAVCFDDRWDDRSPIAQAERIHAPVLLLVSARDRHVPPAHTLALHQRLSGSSLFVLEEASHVLNEAQRQIAWQQVLSFFSSVDSSG